MVRVRRIFAKREIERAFSIRVRVFVREQGVPEELELDGDDPEATHFLAWLRGRPVGTARLVQRKGRAKIGRMAVLKTYRGKGAGRTLLQRAVALARNRRAKTIYLHAQVPVVGFYQKMGFRCVGRVFIEAGIPHRKMLFAPKPARKKQP